MAWRQPSEFPNYEVSDSGLVRERGMFGKIIPTWTLGEKTMVTLRRDGRRVDAEVVTDGLNVSLRWLSREPVAA